MAAVCVCVCVCVEVCTEGGGGSMNKRFTFDQVFGPEATQEEALHYPPCLLPSLLPSREWVSEWVSESVAGSRCLFLAPPQVFEQSGMTELIESALEGSAQHTITIYGRI